MFRYIFIIGLCLLAIFVRLHQIDAQSLWHDEGNSLRLAERSVTDLIDAVGRDIHPPGYYLVLKAWTSPSGTTEFSLRSLSAFWGLLTVAATIGLARRLSGHLMVGLIAGLIVALQPFAVYYAQETRMYAQLGALSITSLWLLLRFIRATPINSWKWAIGLTICNTLGLYTHYTYPFTMLVQGLFFVWLWIRQHPTQQMTQYVVLNLVTLIAFLPWLPTAYDQITTWPTTGDQTALSDRLDRIFIILIYGNTTESIAIAAYLFPVVLLLFSLLPRRGWSVQTAMPLLIVGFSIASLLTSGAYREANLKFLLPAQAATAILLAQGLWQLTRLADRFSPLPSLPVRCVVYTGALLLLIPGLLAGLDRLYNTTDYQRSDYRGIVQQIESTATDNSAIILNAPNQQEVFTYYYDDSYPLHALPRGLGGDDLATQQATLEVLNQHERVFLVLWGQQERDPNAIVQSTLDEQAFVVSRAWYSDVELIQYAVLDSPPSTPSQRMDIAFGELIMLEGYSLSDDTFVAGRGDALGVTLYWRSDEAIAERYKVSVQVLTPQGTLANQHDAEPGNGLQPTSSWQPGEIIVDNHGLVLNPDLPPGIYTLNVVIYDANDPNRRLQPNNDDPNAILQLGTLTLN